MRSTPSCPGRVQRAARAAVGVGDEDADVVAARGAGLRDALGDRAGDPRGAHVQAGVDAVDLDPGEVPGQREQLARERAAADDDDARGAGACGRGRPDCVRRGWHGARR